MSSILNADGSTLVNESYTAYGLRRNPTTWSGAASSVDLPVSAGVTRQGYTWQIIGANNGNTGRLVNSTMGLAGQLVAGNIGSKIGTKMFGNQQIRDAMGRFGKKRSEGMAQIGQMIGGKATLCQSN